MGAFDFGATVAFEAEIKALGTVADFSGLETGGTVDLIREGNGFGTEGTDEAIEVSVDFLILGGTTFGGEYLS